ARIRVARTMEDDLVVLIATFGLLNEFERALERVDGAFDGRLGVPPLHLQSVDLPLDVLEPLLRLLDEQLRATLRVVDEPTGFFLRLPQRAARVLFRLGECSARVVLGLGHAATRLFFGFRHAPSRIVLGPYLGVLREPFDRRFGVAALLLHRFDLTLHVLELDLARLEKLFSSALRLMDNPLRFLLSAGLHLVAKLLRR